ncbi:hypothetical protein EXE30_06770 [Acinetobacter halotolerans]|uniref:Uncharacterized protein n=1 Tax=Acinetobacter halotolerans TaxID=1752076 RepID=A0A4Q6XJ60_9GAMM|nr:hypothetical protein [Acinetobacter halotolerans]RZF53672.1 hypothetical protein EXE30_06770 [Acinetobacter halotolerans]
MRSEFEKWYVDTYYTTNELVPPADLFNCYEDTYLNNDVYHQNLVWQHQQSKVDELKKRVDAFKDHAAMLREAAKSHAYTEREQNILLSQADDIDKILEVEQALKGDQYDKHREKAEQAISNGASLTNHRIEL